MEPNERRLLDNVYKKFQTTMIGAIARFENNFGYLWDNDSKQSLAMENLWEDTRNSILNNGNKQARAAMDDIGDFLVNRSGVNVKQKYHYDFKFNNDQQHGENDEN
jgi:hypothetical protein